MSYMINLTNIIGEFPAWNLSTETRKNKYLEFEAPKRKFQRELIFSIIPNVLFVTYLFSLNILY